jgi:aminocarboxymuconate-semialdehyde decarboxylase
MSIDIHSHTIPGPYVEALRRDPGRFGGHVERDADGEEWLVFDDGRKMNVRTHVFDAEHRLRAMAEVGIDIMVESLLPPLYHYHAPPETAARIVRVVNDAIAEDVSRHPDRIVGMACVPLQDVPGSVRELTRCAEELKMPAVIIGTNVNGKNLDEPELFPFFERARDLDLVIFVHPSDVTARDRLKRYYLTNLIGNPLETSIAVSSLIFGGLLDKLPELKLCFAHGGGYALLAHGRWRHGYGVRKEAQVAISRPFDDYFRMLYFDTLLHDRDALEFAIRSVGTDRLILGTDYPADMGNWNQVTMIKSLEIITDLQKEAILTGNASRLLGL